MIKAAVFDLDDTLFPEREYVRSGYDAVGDYISREYGIKNAAAELYALFEERPEKVFDRWLIKRGLPVTNDSVASLVETYREHTPKLTLSEETENALESLRKRGIKLGIITDGRPSGQRKKIRALGLNELVDEIIITDELGGEEYRKPDPRAFEMMADRLGVRLEEMLYVGDNPKKDFAIKKRLPIKTARLMRDGIYSACEYADGIREDHAILSLSELNNITAGGYDEKEQTVIREKLLGIMDFIHDVCKAEGIRYSLGYGSLIGAIRHKGFVPWDDDMDIVMTRDEYTKFEKAASARCSGDCEFELARKILKVPCVRYKNAPIVDSKRYDGIQIDIFIFDNYPDDPAKQKRLVFKLKTLQGMMHKDKIVWSNYSFKGKVLLFGTKALGVFRSKKSLIRSYDKLSRKYNDTPTATKFVSNASFANMRKQYANELLEETISVPFEDRTYDIYTEYDKLLRMWYGDYMTLPPVEQRVPQHDITVTEV